MHDVEALRLELVYCPEDVQTVIQLLQAGERVEAAVGLLSFSWRAVMLSMSGYQCIIWAGGPNKGARVPMIRGRRFRCAPRQGEEHG